MHRLFRALGIHNTFLEDALLAEDWTKYVLQMVWQFPAETSPTFEQCYLVLRAQYQGRKYSRLLDNFFNIKPLILNSSDTRKFDLVMVAYEAGLILRDDKRTTEVRALLSQGGIDHDQLLNSESRSEIMKVLEWVKL